MTDEELKQQYGIHLTSRLGADADGKEAKWADIDDDEDDWAPETIEWNDGTKTTLTAADLAPAAPVEQPQAESTGAPVRSADERPKPPQFTSSVGPNATVLKIGANAEKQQAQRAAAEKSRPSLEHSRSIPSNTMPAPAPAKSPWAALPPVDKSSPVEITPQPSMPLNRALNAYGMPPPNYAMHASSPAKEMSADDFNRNWKDGSTMQPRELYMPNSGRYEAVSDGRRRMSRNDQGFRAPAVLQRPNAGEGAAEPSAAFQTTRTSSDATRRRASSIVSGGSGQFARRLSMKSGDFGAPVFDNQSSDLGPRPGSRDGPITPLDAPHQQSYAPNTTAPVATGPALDIEAEREKQKQMMKDKIARARQRKVEEEEKLAAEKLERIRKKMEEFNAAQPVPVPKDTEEVAAPEPVLEAPPMALSASHSPPKPPQPLATGEPQQYGMIKVHPLDSNKRLHMDQQRSFPGRDGPVSGVNGIKNVDTQRSVATDPQIPSEPSPKLPKSMNSGWGDLRDHRSAAANLWGISSNKALGNGTFDQTLAGYAPQDLSRTSSSAPHWNGRTPIAGRSPHIPEANLPIASPDPNPLAVDSEADTLFPVVPPAPIGRPQQQPLNLNGGPSAPSGNNLTAWNNFHQVAAVQERSENERLQWEKAARREEEQRTGVRQGPSYTFNETWKQAQIGEQPSQRSVVGKSQSTVPAAFGAVGSLPSGPRGSRFFPSPNINQQPDERRAVTYSYPDIPRSPSPPPAEEFASAHPAFDGSLMRPTVRLPREKVVVKLPPAGPPTPPAEPEDVPPANMSWADRVARGPIVQPRATSMPVQMPLKDWQKRFNGLLKGPAEVESFSRQALDVLPGNEGLSVSLPFGSEPSTSFTTKLVEDEEDLFEDRELASLPTISLPLHALIQLPLAAIPHFRYSDRIETSSADLHFLTPKLDGPSKAQFSLIKFPGMHTGIKRDFPNATTGYGSGPRNRPRGGTSASHQQRSYGGRGTRGRGTAKAA